MTRKSTKSADQTSLGTTETAGALRSPPRAYGQPRRLLPSAPFQSSSAKCRINQAATVVAVGLALWGGSAGTAHAYLDPNTVSFFLQIFAGGIVGSLVVIKMYWSRVKAYFSRQHGSWIARKERRPKD